MSDTTTKWPDRPDIFPCAIHPGKFFVDPELQTATFASQLGRPLFWSGGQATVLQATLADGRKTAVRFLHHKDEEASIRYDSLSRHLVEKPVESMVQTWWRKDGLRVNDGVYPILRMDWIEGTSLDGYISTIVTSATAANDLRTIADVWRLNCQELTRSGMSHGDIHAGNAMVVTSGGGVDLRLVDYDNVWVPGLRVACKEEGNAAFQHPHRKSPDFGPYLDAFPNTMTYLSLRGLASDPTLWRADGADLDDTLLFHKEDLDAPSSKIWTALRNSGDEEVRALAELSIDWLTDAADRYHGLEDAIAAATARTGGTKTQGGSGPGRNTWPSKTAANRETDVPHPPRTGPPNPRQWAPHGPPARPQGQPGHHNRPVQPTFGRQQQPGPGGPSMPRPQTPAGQSQPGQQRWAASAGPGAPTGMPAAGRPPTPPVPKKTGGQDPSVVIAIVVLALLALVAIIVVFW